MTTVDKNLKRKITERWNILVAGRAQLDATEAAALAQLEYILLEAGLLARKRTPKTPKTVSEPMTLAGGDDNTMSLSEVEGITANE
jgi:hypothetical protein